MEIKTRLEGSTREAYYGFNCYCLNCKQGTTGYWPKGTRIRLNDTGVCPNCSCETLRPENDEDDYE